MAMLPVLQSMLEQVAKALGPELCQQMTFVGGCTTGLLLTDDFTKEQVRSTDDVDLIVHVDIRLVTPVYFIATKLEAYKGRGKADALNSRDIEDILNLVDGREELISEVKSSEADVQTYIAAEFSVLLKDNNFEYAVASQARGNDDRESIIYQRLDALAAIPSTQNCPENE